MAAFDATKNLDLLTPLDANLPQLEVARSASVVIDGDHIIKQSLKGCPTIGSAEDQLANLLVYARQLEDEPIDVAPLVDAGIRGDDGDYHVVYLQKIVQGQSVLSLPIVERKVALAEIIAGICAMRTFGDNPNVLATPLDNTAKNWHIDPETKRPVFIDTFPPMSRDAHGKLPIWGNESTRSYMEQYAGTKSGAIIRLMYSAIGLEYPAAQPLRRISHLLANADEWLHELMPSDADPTVGAAIHREIQMRFVPYLAATALRTVRQKMPILK